MLKLSNARDMVYMIFLNNVIKNKNLIISSLQIICCYLDYNNV